MASFSAQEVLSKKRMRCSELARTRPSCRKAIETGLFGCGGSPPGKTAAVPCEMRTRSLFVRSRLLERGYQVQRWFVLLGPGDEPPQGDKRLFHALAHFREQHFLRLAHAEWIFE